MTHTYLRPKGLKSITSDQRFQKKTRMIANWSLTPRIYALNKLEVKERKQNEYQLRYEISKILTRRHECMYYGYFPIKMKANF